MERERIVNITVRGGERSAVASLLEADYASADQCAQAVIKAVVAMLSERDAYGLRLPVGPTLNLACGPWWHGTAVRSVARTLPDVTVHKLYAPTRLLAALDDSSHRTGVHCPECSHPLFAHRFPGKLGCVVKKCKCRKTAP